MALESGVESSRWGQTGTAVINCHGCVEPKHQRPLSEGSKLAGTVVIMDGVLMSPHA